MGGYRCGQWKRNRPTGFGFEAYPNGSFYQGTFDNDQRDGLGVYEFPNGLYYAGGRYGSGIATDVSGKKRYGSGIATDVSGKKFVLTYDRTGKLLAKHEDEFTETDKRSSDAAEREVVAEVLKVTLEVVAEVLKVTLEHTAGYEGMLVRRRYKESPGIAVGCAAEREVVAEVLKVTLEVRTRNRNPPPSCLARSGVMRRQSLRANAVWATLPRAKLPS
ncbi:hypothetical protein T484DRAFT_1774652 [Baffinella frigidus]|nr:hypothetical protein T484DRAFT_1774652 [Cryptophyta sp. CCMP2293]